MNDLEKQNKTKDNLVKNSLFCLNHDDDKNKFNF